jgi:hypothetical protein
LEVYALSNAWYLAQILPLPHLLVVRLQKAAGDFLWRGSLKRLANEELHAPPPLLEGSLRWSVILERSQSLVAQAWHRLATCHPTPIYWLGLYLRSALPGHVAGPNAEAIPPYLKNLGTLLLGVFWLPTVCL